MLNLKNGNFVMSLSIEYPVYYTILWDPMRDGVLRFYDHIFYTDPSVPLKRVNTEFNLDLFAKVVVVQVTFSDIF